jgi:hypothetical protein
VLKKIKNTPIRYEKESQENATLLGMGAAQAACFALQQALKKILKLQSTLAQLILVVDGNI